jgi:hypothetical protein
MGEAKKRLVENENWARANESAPDSLSHGTPVEQPSPEVCSIEG